MSLSMYAFRDRKSSVLSNHFVTTEPFEKVKQNISISLLQLSMKDPTNPFVLYSDDYELIFVCNVPDFLAEGNSYTKEFIRCSDLLSASRKAFNAGKGQTSPDDQLDKLEE